MITKGELYHHEVPDLELNGPLPVSFSRYYASGLLSDGTVSRMGINWRHNYEWSLTADDASASITDSEGRVIRFELVDEVWVLAQPAEISFQLQLISEEYWLADPRSELIYIFNLLI